ncbi:MAG: ParB/RepB/Spo0J family partition protein [Planctomycetales bacterium]|nr:ParB/RepB/Spo0J family partition protein [Planctomycetales bacterium]
MEEHNPLEEAHGTRRRLGRGLTSLLGGGGHEPSHAAQDEAAGEFLQIDVDGIFRNPLQPRQEFEPTALAELADSVAQHGVLQPLLVRRLDGGFQIVAGERRWLAAKKAGLHAVPCRVVVMDDRVVTEVAIIENLQRADLNELEKAQAFQDYLEKFSGTIEELARKLGKDRSTVSNCLRLLELPDFVKLALRSGKVTAGHARALLPLEEESQQIALCQRIQSEQLTVRQTEEAVRQTADDADTVPFQNPDSKRSGISPQILALQQQLRDLVGAKVEIKLKGKAGGRLVIHFSSNDEFERILQQLRRAS